LPPPPPLLPHPPQHVELICGMEHRKVTLQYSAARAAYPKNTIDIFHGKDTSVSLREVFEIWNPPNKARLIELLGEDKAEIEEMGTAKKLKQDSPVGTESDISAAAPMKQESVQETLPNQNINEPQVSRIKLNCTPKRARSLKNPDTMSWLCKHPNQ